MSRCAVLLFLVALAGCGGGERATGDRTTTTAPSVARPAAPAISGTTVDGEALSLSELRGEPVLVNVWSSW